MAQNIFKLNFVDEEGAEFTLRLTSLPKELTSLCVVLFEPNVEIHSVWMIEELQLAAGEWRIKTNLGAVKEEEEMVVYCLKRSEDCPSDDLREVITRCSTSMDDFKQIVVKTIDCRRRSFQANDIAYLTGHSKRSEMNLTQHLTPPNSYSIHLSGEPQLNKPLLLIFGLKNIAYVTVKYLMLTKPCSTEMVIPLTFNARSIYKCAVVELIHEEESFQSGRMSHVVFKSVMVKEELEALKQKAEEFMQSMTTLEVRVFHRTKPKAVMDEIMKSQNGLMKTHLKDNNGDPHSPINTNIKGIFFNVDTDNSYYHGFSPFGDRRLHIPVSVLFNQGTNLYFADFYCVSTGGPHYLTLVLTKPGSESDNFSEDFLLKLNKSNNPFLFQVDGKFKAKEKEGCFIIEVFYTENVDIRSLQRQYNRQGVGDVYFTDVRPFGMGDSAENGYPKIPGCQTCNI